VHPSIRGLSSYFETLIVIARNPLKPKISLVPLSL
jgi:hypothetical protein